MSRILKEIEIEGRPAIALFDTGAFHSYIRRDLIAEVPKRVLPMPYRVGLGGELIEIREVCVAIGAIEGMSLDIEAVAVDDLGRADGQRLDAIIGALVMEKWEIKLDPRSGTLDLEGLRRREFTEFRQKSLDRLEDRSIVFGAESVGRGAVATSRGMEAHMAFHYRVRSRTRALWRLSIAAVCAAVVLAAASASLATEIQGSIRDTGGNPVPGVQVLFSGGLPAQVTDAAGRYSVAAPDAAATYQVTPWKAGYFFAPPTASASISGTSATADFTARSAKASLTKAPTITITSITPPAPAVINPFFPNYRYGQGIIVTWVITGTTRRPTHNHIEWWTSTDPTSIRSTSQDRSAPYRASLTLPAVDCTLTLRAHAIIGGVDYYSAPRDFVVGSGIDMVPTITITSVPTGVNPGQTFTVEWMITSGRPQTLNRVEWGLSDTTMTRTTASDTVAPYRATLTAPNTTCTIYLQVHAIISGEDYYSDVAIVEVPSTTTSPIVILEPTGDPTSRLPTEAAAAEFIYTPDPIDPGIAPTLSIHVRCRVNPTGIGFENCVRAAISPVGVSTLQWSTPWTGGALGRPVGSSTRLGQAVYDPATDEFSVDAVFIQMPRSNSDFGPKTLWVQLINPVTGSVIASASTQIEVFYDQIATNNPGTGSNAGANWFYYWRTGGVISQSSYVRYTLDSSVYGYFNPPQPVTAPVAEVYDEAGTGAHAVDPANVYVSDLAATVNQGPMTFYSNLNGWSVRVAGTGVGPECVIEVLAHQFRHKWFFANWFWMIQSAQDPGDGNADPDGDGVPNQMEEWCNGLMTDYNDPDTYNLGGLSAVPGDQEVRCLRQELDTDFSTSLSKDWGYPGRNSAPPAY